MFRRACNLEAAEELGRLPLAWIMLPPNPLDLRRLSDTRYSEALCTVGARAEGSFCAPYGFQGGATNCGFYSFQQCQAAISGNDRYCSRNVFYGAAIGLH